MTTALNAMQFFVLRVASNKEDRVREALVRKVKIEGVEDVVGRILVPTERVRSMKGGVRKESDRKLYPGYVFIELTLDKNGMIPEKVWFLIKETDGVGDFIGSNGKPTPMSPKDQAKAPSWSASHCTMSASRPGARTPRSGAPSTVAPPSVAARSASLTLMPNADTAIAMTSDIEVMPQ